MPYIAQEKRKEIDEGRLPDNVGELNYKTSAFIDRYITEHGESYSTYNKIIGELEMLKFLIFNESKDGIYYGEFVTDFRKIIGGFSRVDLLGVLSCIQMEIYRRKISEYETKKMKINGDVWTVDLRQGV